MSDRSGGGGSAWEQEADRTTGNPTGTGGTQSPNDAPAGMSIGAGMGGFNSYDPDGPISTSMDETEAGEDAGGDHITANQGSTGGPSGGAPSS
jgi:hypothetical protein